MYNVSVKGAEIPVLGLGTWQIKGDDGCRLISKAIELGYRHIDTAPLYENEAEVGNALSSAGIDRRELFITTKVWWESLYRDKFWRSVETSLAKLQLDTVDLLLIHWPHPSLPVEAYLEDLMRVQEQGMARFIGVSNFTPSLLGRAVATGAELVTNQVEYHPLLDQSATLEAGRRHGLSLTAYTPLARGRIFTKPTINDIARAHGKSAAQVTLRWLIQQEDVIAIPRTATPARLEENLDIFDFELTEEEMSQIFALASPKGRLVNPGFGPEWER